MVKKTPKFLTAECDLLEAIRATIHTSDIPPKALADRVGWTYNLLMRSALETDSGVNFPLSKLIPLIEATRNTGVLDYLFQALIHVYLENGDDRLLRYLAPRFNFILVKTPSGTSRLQARNLGKFQKTVGAFILGLGKYDEDDTDPATIDKLEISGNAVMSDIAGFLRKLKDRQEHFDFDREVA